MDALIWLVIMSTVCAAASRPNGEQEPQAVKGNTQARGSRVLTTTAFSAGTVEDVMFDGRTDFSLPSRPTAATSAPTA